VSYKAKEVKNEEQRKSHDKTATPRDVLMAIIGEKKPSNYAFWGVLGILLALLIKELMAPSWIVEWSHPKWGSVTVDPVYGLGIGLVAGFMGGAAGAFISLFAIPLYTLWLGLPLKIAQGTNSLAATIIGFFAAWVHFRKGTANLKIAAVMMVFGIIGAAIGAKISLGMPTKELRFYFSSVVFLAALWMFYRAIKPTQYRGARWVHKYAENYENAEKKTPVPLIEGEWQGQKYKVDALTPGLGNLGIAILAGVLGVGGGFLFTPMLHFVYGLPMVVAIGTGNFVKIANIGSQFVIRGVAETVIYPLAIFGMLGGYFGAKLGRRLALAVDPRYLRAFFGAALIIVGLRFAGIKLW
jgi:hypothetical protein